MIGGNVDGIIQVKQVVKNELGEGIKTWTKVQILHGFLDFISGESKYTPYNAKIEDSTHIFICDYTEIKVDVGSARMIIGGNVYDIKYIDNPMGLNQHLEVFLTFTGEKYAENRNKCR